MSQGRVLVTGGSGFIAGHCILQLVEQGYEVRATLRTLSHEDAVTATLEQAGLTNSDSVRFVAADLTDDAGWPAAVTDVDYVLHVASPVHTGKVTDANDVIEPAPRRHPACPPRRQRGWGQAGRSHIGIPRGGLRAPRISTAYSRSTTGRS